MFCLQDFQIPGGLQTVQNLLSHRNLPKKSNSMLPLVVISGITEPHICLLG